MYNFDDKIRNAMKQEIEKPLRYEYAIRNALNKNEDKKISVFFIKVAAILMCVVTCCTGAMAVTYVVYEKVWKEPVLVTEDEKNKEIEEIKSEITDDEKKDFISDNEAIEIAKSAISILEYDEKENIEAELVRGYDKEDKYHYLVHMDELLIEINPETRALEYIGDQSILNKDIKCDEVSEEFIKETANNIYEKLGIIKENDGYEMLRCKRQNVLFGEHINDLWQVSYAKMYNGEYDEDTIFTICFAICDGNTVIYSIRGKRNTHFEDNPVVISKEDAINIATNKEKEFSDLEIISVNAILSIEKMNIFIYALENNIENNNGEYKIDDMSRNVWKIEIKHKKDNKPRSTELETVKTMYDKAYYIDATTGEIIGGNQIEINLDT